MPGWRNIGHIKTTRPTANKNSALPVARRLRRNRRHVRCFGLTEESLGYATLCMFDRVFPPHPDPLPQGEGTAGVCLVLSRWSLAKLWYGCDREAVDRSPSPQ